MIKKIFSPLKNTPSTPIYLSVAGHEAGLRLDCWILTKLEGNLSRNYIQRMIREGSIKVNGVQIEKNNYLIKQGETFSVLLEPNFLNEKTPSAPKAENIPLNILFEDKDIIILNKPAGLVVHPGAGNDSGTLVHALLYHCTDPIFQEKNERPGIVHRLDKNTSGIMLIARSHRAYEYFKKSFAERKKIKRVYQALVWNIPQKLYGTIDAPLGRSKNPTKRAVVHCEAKDAREAITHFKVIQKFSLHPEKNLHASLVECHLETGRTHQIRVHMAHIGHPIIGDPEYGKGFFSKENITPEPIKTLLKNFSRQALHAHTLSFEHPTSHSIMEVAAPLPKDMEHLLHALKAYAIK